MDTSLDADHDVSVLVSNLRVAALSVSGPDLSIDSSAPTESEMQVHGALSTRMRQSAPLRLSRKRQPLRFLGQTGRMWCAATHCGLDVCLTIGKFCAWQRSEERGLAGAPVAEHHNLDVLTAATWLGGHWWL